MDNTGLKTELKEHIIRFLNLQSMTTEQIKDDAPFFGETGLGLDSIDSIELIVLLEREYGIKIQDPKEGRKVLIDLNTMADYVQQHRIK